VPSARMFIDFWNFHLQWRRMAGEGKECDWQKLPHALMASAQATATQLSAMTLDDIRIYASVNPEKDSKLRGWLDSFLDRQPGFRVFVRERRSRKKPVFCSNCRTDTDRCPNCKALFERAPEKGVDSAILTDMFSLAWEEAYDVAVLVTGDADLVPAVEKIQDRGLKIINATWRNYGNELAKACWASFPIDPLVGTVCRPAQGGAQRA
jgi:uncharacterized LabA/DUF88 family protein